MDLKQLWHPDDPEWMAARKKEWRNVKQNLNKMTLRVGKRLQKYHKELFFYGDTLPERSFINKGENSPFDFARPFFELWYLPEINDEIVSELYANQTDPFGLNKARDFLFLFRLRDFATEYGMLGGREEYAIKLLFPGLDWKEERAFEKYEKGFPLSVYPCTLIGYCTGSTFQLLNGVVNPYAPGQYLWDHLDYVLEHSLDDITKSDDREFSLKSIKFTLHYLADFDVRENAPRDNPASVNLHKKLLARFNAEEFGPRLMGYWHETKAEVEAGIPPPSLNRR